MLNKIHLCSHPVVLLLFAGIMLSRCSEAPTDPLVENQTVKEQASTSADVGATTEDGIAAKLVSPVIEWHAGSSLNCAIVPDACPLVAQAANGHTIEILQDDGAGSFGGGTMSVRPKSVTGTGTFVHKDADGAELGSGTWAATELLSFKDWGQSPVFCDPGFPNPAFCAAHAGRALIRVHLVAESGAEFDGILHVECHLPEVKVPGSYEEGVKLSLANGPNFNKIVTGVTVFFE